MTNAGDSEPTPTTGASNATSQDVAAPNATATPAWFAASLVFGASAVVLTLEIIAGRLMAPYVGVSQETFTGIIGTVLAGIAIGAAVGGSMADRRDPWSLIGPALLLGGALTWASLPILRIVGPAVGSGPVAIVTLTAAAFLAPATVLSSIAPMIAKLRISSLTESGSVVGRLSAAGTFGSLAGSFLTGFVLVAALPTRWVVIGIGALCIVAGVVLSLRRRTDRSQFAILAALTAVAGVGALAVPSPCDLESAYFCIRVEQDSERPSGRSLILDQVRHAYVDLDDPAHLELRYMRLIADVVDTIPDGPVSTLQIGGGGFTLPAYLDATRPGSTSTVLEIDPTLLDVAREDLAFDESSTRTIIGDARLALDDLPNSSFDLVVGDAFAGSSVPWHLTTVETIRSVQRVMRPDGVYVMNVIDGGSNRYAAAQAATLAAVFEHVSMIVPSDGVGEERVNQILVASDAPIVEPDVDPVDGRVLAPQDVDDFIGDARTLRDDFAPVDQMLLRR